MRFLAIITTSSLLISCQQVTMTPKMVGKEIMRDTVLKHKTELKKNEGVVYHGGSPFSGTVISYYDSGTPAETIDYVDGKKMGLWKKWFANGDISFESPYLNGRQHGVTKSWWKNGNVRSVSTHFKGVLNGIQYKWYRTGEKFKETTVVDGALEGLQKAWRKNGKLYANFQVKNGRIFGLKRSNLCYQLKDEKLHFKE